jgi:hypothetical protein
MLVHNVSFEPTTKGVYRLARINGFSICAKIPADTAVDAVSAAFIDGCMAGKVERVVSDPLIVNKTLIGHRPSVPVERAM